MMSSDCYHGDHTSCKGATQKNGVWSNCNCKCHTDPVNDNVEHPKHYNEHPSGIECITITRHMSFNLGNVFKYIWRNEGKNGLEDLKKAKWYLEDEIKKREDTIAEEQSHS